MKKIFALTLSVIWMFTLGIYSSAEDNSVSDYQFLINQGYDEDYLDNLSEGAMQRMVELIGDGYVSDIEVTKTVFSSNNSLTRDNINPDNLILEISTGTICQYGTNIITCILVSVTWEWGRWDPLYRGKDAIAVNWDEDLFIYSEDSFYAEDVYRFFKVNDWTVLNSSDIFSIANQGGIGYYTDLEEWMTYVGGTMIFLLEPTEYMVEGNTYRTSITVEYAHEKSALTGLSFSYKNFGIGISWENECDTMADTSTIKFSR